MENFTQKKKLADTLLKHDGAFCYTKYECFNVWCMLGKVSFVCFISEEEKKLKNFENNMWRATLTQIAVLTLIKIKRGNVGFDSYLQKFKVILI